MKRAVTKWRAAVLVFGVVAVAGGTFAATRAVSKTSRQEEVAHRGAIVMPFDLERTTHIFRPRAFGGVQTVVADNPEDRDQVRLIRQHLAGEAQAFSEGDFGDPARIHGDGMPGLEELQENYGAMRVTFSTVPAGGRIIYRAEDTVLVRALHDWFAARAGDHGSHAQHERM